VSALLFVFCTALSFPTPKRARAVRAIGQAGPPHACTPHPTSAFCSRDAVFAHGGHLFAAANGASVGVYNTYTAECIGNLRGHNSKVRGLKKPLSVHDKAGAIQLTDDESRPPAAHILSRTQARECCDGCALTLPAYTPRSPAHAGAQPGLECR
jgi:hypothetical protein